MSVPKSIAKGLLKELSISTLPIDPYDIANQLEIEVSEDKCEGYTGMIIVVNGNALISVKMSIRELTRKRFTVAHEIGHYRIPGHLTKNNLFFKCTDRDLNTFWEHNSKETEANEFAAELLMPEKDFRKIIRQKELTYDLLRDLTDKFGTSLTATSFRYVELSGNYALIRSENSVIKGFFKGGDFPFYVRGDGPLDNECMAIEFFNGKDLPTTFEAVPVGCWLDDYNVEEDMEILELSIPLPHYNEVLTFLYTDEYVEDDADEYLEALDGYPKFKKR